MTQVTVQNAAWEIALSIIPDDSDGKISGEVKAKSVETFEAVLPKDVLDRSIKACG